ncbi:hypothetical protein JHK87_009677 [Glycine soja]|nr:hypothetical protein JHK87_009677 [Glycine soja]
MEIEISAMHFVGMDFVGEDVEKVNNSFVELDSKEGVNDGFPKGGANDSLLPGLFDDVAQNYKESSAMGSEMVVFGRELMDFAIWKYNLISCNWAPPLVVVVDNQLYYDEEHLTNMVNKYDKERHTWSEMGRLPVHVDSFNGWGLAFKGYGEQLLVPLVDEAKLVGYSCRREWISTMVSSLTTYLAKEIFPSYSSQVDEERVTGIQSSAIVSWLHLIDLMIAFDKRIKSLELSKDVIFLEMGMDEDDQPEMENNSNNYGELLAESSIRFIFYDEIKKLEDFRTQWVEKISLVIFKGFDCHSRDYVNNKRQWQEGEEGWTVSKTLIEALDYL